jgi:hypothetical protein
MVEPFASGRLRRLRSTFPSRRFLGMAVLSIRTCTRFWSGRLLMHEALLPPEASEFEREELLGQPLAGA